MILQTTALNVTQVPFPPEHEKKSLTRAGARDRLIRSREPRAESREPRAESREPRAESREPRAESREPRAYGFVMSAGAFHASVERAVPARLLA